MPTLIDLPIAPVKPAPQLIAESMLHKLNATLAQRIHDHRAFYRSFWDSPEIPDDILLAMGAYAPVLLAAASENLEHITRLAALVGKTLHDFIAPEDYAPRRAFVIGQSITLAPPAEGYDAWGRLIPVIPEPEPELEPIEE